MTVNYEMPAGIKLGPLSITSQDLSRALEFYQGVLGMKLNREEENIAYLGFDEQKIDLELIENRQAELTRGRTGLYHFALLVPSRAELAGGLKHLLESDYPLGGASDHGVSEALYLSDPDGNGIEIYCDRPREEWPIRNGELRMDTRPLDAQDLLRESGGKWSGLDPQTILGHVHLKVASIPEAEAFYLDLLGFKLMQRYGPAASFVSAGGYHHHIGFNTWESDGAQPPQEEAVGLNWFGLRLPDEASPEALLIHLKENGHQVKKQQDGMLIKDPSNNGILLRV